jgi:branched-chain amino acid transport system permease protein
MRARLIAPVAAAALVLALPFIADNYILRIATSMLMYVALASSWNYIGGFAGYPSFATAAFFGLGAYAGGILQAKGIPMVAAWAMAGGIVTAFAAGIGRAILRLRGHYFAIASLVIADVLREIINGMTGVTGGGMGLNVPVMKIDVTAQARLFYAAMLVVAVLAILTSAFLDRSRIGFGLRCIEQNEDVALRLGVHTARYKTIAFALSSVYPAIAGAVYASWVSYIDPAEAFDVLFSIKPIIMALLGGAGTVAGPIVGAFVFQLTEELVWRNFLSVHLGLLGLIVVLLILFLPHGLLQHRLLRGRTRPLLVNAP